MMNNEILQATKSMKLLGVILDSGLNMDKHGKNLKSEVMRKINQL